MLCLTGEVGWARLSTPRRERDREMVGATPIALFLREHADAVAALSSRRATRATTPDVARRRRAACARRAARARRVVRPRDRAATRSRRRRRPRAALGELVAAGLVASDGFAGLRAIVRAAAGRPAGPRRRRDRRRALVACCATRRAVQARGIAKRPSSCRRASLLRRYGVVFRRLLAREANAAPWRELARVYRRLEARGEIRGGRFVAGMSGEQFALAGRGRAAARDPPHAARDGRLRRHQRRRPAQPRRHHHGRRARARRRVEPHRLSRRRPDRRARRGLRAPADIDLRDSGGRRDATDRPTPSGRGQRLRRRIGAPLRLRFAQDLGLRGRGHADSRTRGARRPRPTAPSP